MLTQKTLFHTVTTVLRDLICSAQYFVPADSAPRELSGGNGQSGLFCCENKPAGSAILVHPRFWQPAPTRWVANSPPRHSLMTSAVVSGFQLFCC